MVENSPGQRIEQPQASPEANVAPANSQAPAPQAVADDALLPANAVGEMNRLQQQNALEQIRDTLVAINEVTYLWSVPDDQLTWSDNLSAVIPNLFPGRSTTGRGYASLLDHENEYTRYDQVVGSKEVDQGQGVPFCIEYKLWPAGVGKGEPVWIEDSGRWFAGPEGAAGYAIGAIRVVNSRKANEENLKFLSQCDPLTGMMNRGRIMEALGQAIAVAERTGSSCSFILAAMDNLDVVNDAYGFDVADQVIAAVGDRLGQHMRSGDSIGRYAGNKFAIILGNCNEAALKVACDRFLQSVRNTVIETDNGPVWSSISIGGVVLPTHARQVHEAMVHAEDALSEAKNRPTDCFVTFKPSKRRASMRERNVSCAGEIVAALKQNRFVLAFQPIMNSETGQPAMYEALLRIAGHDGEVLSAGHLLAVAEKLGLIRLIDRRVLEMGVAILQQQPTLRLTLNISGVTATDTRWFEMFVDYIAENKQVAERLTVEITETVALADLEEMAQFIERLRSYGCKVAIDDFGAGYTSFRNLQVLNVDMVKLDGSFCEDLAGNPDNQYFVKTLVDMAKRFNIEIVAEWVQRQEDADLLREWGVKYLQGHLFGVASIDPPWGRLEQKPVTDVDELDPVRKVLHAGKPDFPGLRSTEESQEKWSAETHADRRVSSLPETTPVSAGDDQAENTETPGTFAGVVADSATELVQSPASSDPFAAAIATDDAPAQPHSDGAEYPNTSREASETVSANDHSGVETAEQTVEPDMEVAAEVSAPVGDPALQVAGTSDVSAVAQAEQFTVPSFSAAENEDLAVNAEPDSAGDVPVFEPESISPEGAVPELAGQTVSSSQPGLTAHLTGRPLPAEQAPDASAHPEPNMEALAVEHPQYSDMQPAPEFEPAQPTVNVVAPAPQPDPAAAVQPSLEAPQQLADFELAAEPSAHDPQTASTGVWAGDISQAEQQNFDAMQHGGLVNSDSKAAVPESDPFAAPILDPLQPHQLLAPEPEVPQDHNQQANVDPGACGEAEPDLSPVQQNADQTVEVGADTAQVPSDPFAAVASEVTSNFEQTAPQQSAEIVMDDPFAGSTPQSALSPEQVAAQPVAQNEPAEAQPTAADPFAAAMAHPMQSPEQQAAQPIAQMANVSPEPAADPFAGAMVEPKQMQEQQTLQMEPSQVVAAADPFAAAMSEPLHVPEQHAPQSVAQLDQVAVQPAMEQFAAQVPEVPHMPDTSGLHPNAQVAQHGTQQFANPPTAIAAEPASMPQQPASPPADPMHVQPMQASTGPAVTQAPASEHNGSREPADPEEFARKLQEALGPLMSGGQQ